MRIPLLCLVLCLAWANSWSAEAPKDNSKANQQATKADQRGTKNTPFVIEALPSKHTHTKTDDEKKQEQVKAREDSLIAESTFALAVITGFLALFTLGLMIFTYRLWTASGVAHADLEADHRDQQILMVQGSPTIILNEGRQKLYGNVGYGVIEANIKELLRSPVAGAASWC